MEGTKQQRRFLGGPYRVAVRDVPPSAGRSARPLRPRGLRQTGRAELDWVQDPLGIFRGSPCRRACPGKAGRRAPSSSAIDHRRRTDLLSPPCPTDDGLRRRRIRDDLLKGVAPAEARRRADDLPTSSWSSRTNDQDSSDAFRQNGSRTFDVLKRVALVVGRPRTVRWKTVFRRSTMSIRDVVTDYPNTPSRTGHVDATDAMPTSDGVHPRSHHEARWPEPAGADPGRLARGRRGTRATSCVTPASG